MTTQHREESFENRTVPLKISTAVLIIFSTMTTVASVMATYYNLKGDIKDVATKADVQTQLDNVRFNAVEGAEREDHEWLRSLSHRISVIEEQNGVKVNQKDSENHK